MKLNLVAKLVSLSLSLYFPDHCHNLGNTQIRGMNITDAFAQMKFCEKKPSKFVETVNKQFHVCRPAINHTMTGYYCVFMYTGSTGGSEEG